MWIIDILRHRYHKKAEISDAMKRLVELNDHLDIIDDAVIMHADLMRDIGDSLELAIWAKNIDNRFVYANKKCCDDLLHCTEEEVIMAADSELPSNTLVVACTSSDDIVRATLTPMRFIEHNGLWWDTLKSPLYSDEGLIGTIGVAKDITYVIPVDIRESFEAGGTIEIPLDVELCKDEIIKLLTGNQI